MKLRCGCCRQETLTALLRAPDRDGNPVEIYHCSVCCALTPGYPPSSQAMIAAQTSFHERFWSGDSLDRYILDRDAMRGVLQFHHLMLDKSSHHLVYDLGAGRANLLACLIQDGYAATGCEPSAELVDKARRYYQLDEHQLACVDIDAFLAAHHEDVGKVTSIFLWHVIEHLEQPVETLRACTRHLADDGVIIAQGPLLAPEYVYREHNFLHSESNIAWLARATDLKVLFCEAQNPQRFVSFVLAKKSHPHPEQDVVFIADALGATGCLYFTQSMAIRALADHVASYPAATK